MFRRQINLGQPVGFSFTSLLCEKKYLIFNRQWRIIGLAQNRTTCSESLTMPTQPSENPIHGRAEEQLRYIRDAMSRASAYTMIPGWGGVLMGAMALVATAAGAQVTSERIWLSIWLVTAALALGAGSYMVVRKARKAQAPVFSGAGRRFWISLGTPVAVGGVMTLALYSKGLYELMPGIWMLLFGTGVVTGGILSVRIVPLTGVCFLITGSLSLFLPLYWGNLLMGLSFGGCHIVFGAIIARNYGG